MQDEITTPARPAFDAARDAGINFPLDAEQRLACQRAFQAMPGINHMNGVLDLSDAQVVRLAIEQLMPHHRGGMRSSAVNGAVISSLFDGAIAIAGLLHLPRLMGATVELSVKFMRPVRGEAAVAHARVVKCATAMVFAEAILLDENGTLCASATGIVAGAGTSQYPS